MARWRLENWDDDNSFILDGPISGHDVLRQLGSLFPEDSAWVIERASGQRESVAQRSLDAVEIRPGDRLELPGIPVAGGPLMYVMSRLLGPEGCPWDKKQTPETLLRYLLDESYEAAEALMAKDMDAYIEELGDVLLQVVFQGTLLDSTSFPDISLKQAQKLVRRHPHVFSDETWDDSDQVRAQWDNLKATEPPHQRQALWVYPSLVAAKRLSKLGINPETEVYQEILALLEVYFSKSQGKIEEILADAAWAIASGGSIQHQDAEWALWKKLAQMTHDHGEILKNLR